MEELYDVRVTVRSNVKLIEDIKGFLSIKPNREKLFRDTVYGPWLDIQSHENDSHMMHYVLQHQVKTDSVRFDSPPFIFHIGDHYLHFGRKEFCLITGFRFDFYSEKHEKMSSFFDRIFPDIPSKKGFKKIDGFALLKVLKDKRCWFTMLDEDAVRLCLLICCELVFMGKEKRNFMSKHIMWLVDDLNAWNTFPWGEYMWEKFYQRTVNVVYKHAEHHSNELKKNPNYNAAYNLYGFAFALKVWVLETYPKCHEWWSKRNNTIPRGLAWSNVSTFEKSDYDALFGPMSIPNVVLDASPEEMNQPWYKDSLCYIQRMEKQNGRDFQDVEEGKIYVGTGDDKLGDWVDVKNSTTTNQNSVAEVDGHMDSSSVGVESSETMHDDIEPASNPTSSSTTTTTSQSSVVIQQGPQANSSSTNATSVTKNAVSAFFSEYDVLKREVLLIKKRRDSEIDDLITRFSKLETTETFVAFKSLVASEINKIKSLPIEGPISNVIVRPQETGSLLPQPKDSSSVFDELNDGKACPSVDPMEIDGEIPNEVLCESQHGLHLLIKALGPDNNESPTLDAVVPPKEEDHVLFSFKPKEEIDEPDVTRFDSDYMSLMNLEDKADISCLPDFHFHEEEPKKPEIDIIPEQVGNDSAEKASVGVKGTSSDGIKVEDSRHFQNGLKGMLVTKKNSQRGLRPNYLLRSGALRKKKLSPCVKQLFGQQSDTTPVVIKKKTKKTEPGSYTSLFELEDISGNPRIRSINQIMTHDPFIENLSRPADSKSDKVKVPAHMSEFITNKGFPDYRFPWGKRDIVISRAFWLSLSCLSTGKSGWLTDHHLDLWIDLMWSLRTPEADWAIVSVHFSNCILNGMMQDYFSNGVMYPLPWSSVEKVYFPVNEPKKHWCLAELEIRTGVITFYDSLGWAGGSSRRWWRQMRKYLPEKLGVYMNKHGILEQKGISDAKYKFTYKYAKVPMQAPLFGDCGVWVCIFLYRLCRNLPVAIENDPLDTALAYREMMLQYFWNHKIPIDK